MDVWQEILLVIGSVIGFALIFALWWMFVVWLISRFGWNKLAARYATDQQPWGDLHTGQSMLAGGSRYRRSMNLTTNESGIFADSEHPDR